MKKTCLTLGLFLAAAAESSAANGWSEYLTIKTLHAESNSNLIVVGTEGGISYNGCLVDKWIVAPTNESYQNRVYSMLLTAMSTGDKVKLWYVDSPNLCGSWNYHLTTAAMIVK